MFTWLIYPVTQKTSGEYSSTSPIEKLEEVKLFIENLTIDHCEFASDHFTNNIWVNDAVIYTGVYGHLPQDKQKMLDTINNTIEFLSSVDGEIVDATILYDKGLITSL